MTGNGSIYKILLSEFAVSADSHGSGYLTMDLYELISWVLCVMVCLK